MGENYNQLPWVYNTKEAATKFKEGIKKINQNNRAQNKLGFRIPKLNYPAFVNIYIL